MQPTSISSDHTARDVLEICSLPRYKVVGLDTLAPAQCSPYPTPYLFGFVVDIYWMIEYGEKLIAAGYAQTDDDPFRCARAWIRNHCQYIHMTALHPEKGLDLFCWWIGTNQVEWGIDMAKNLELQQQLKDAFSTTTEPKWYAIQRPVRH